MPRFPYLLVLALAFSALADGEPRRRNSKIFDQDKIDVDVPVKTAEDDSPREGRVFSLFSIVTFRNDPCTSDNVLAGSRRRNGTCLTSSECASRSGGRSAGNCAAGFGVCCVFLIMDTTATISENETYVQNPGYAGAYTETDSVTYTVRKSDDTVRFLRLDFETFTIVGPADSLETDGGSCTRDIFQVMTITNQEIPDICGMISGQHMYVDMGADPDDRVTLELNFEGDSTIRMWDIKLTQVPAGGRSSPPADCLQYFQGLTGRITTFNFLTATGQSHLANQDYSVCIRPEAGFCCVEYQVCEDDNSMSLFVEAAASQSNTDGECLQDFIVINGGMATCLQRGNPPTVDRFCGGFLNTVRDQIQNIPICDCTGPFRVGIRTDILPDPVPNVNNRGLCLEFRQIACN